MHVEFSESFPDYTTFICKFKIESAFYSWNPLSLEVGDI